MAAWTKEKVELHFGKAKTTKSERPKETPVSFYVAGMEDAKRAARDPRVDLEALYRRSEALMRAAAHELGVCVGGASRSRSTTQERVGPWPMR